MRTEVVYFGFGFSLAGLIMRFWLLESGLSDDLAFLLQIIGFVITIIGAFMPRRCPTLKEVHRWIQQALREDKKRED